MLVVPGNARVFICHHPMSMHKSFEGLSAVVEELFPQELFTGSFFVFINRLKSHTKEPLAKSRIKQIILG